MRRKWRCSSGILIKARVFGALCGSHGVNLAVLSDPLLSLLRPFFRVPVSVDVVSDLGCVFASIFGDCEIRGYRIFLQFSVAPDHCINDHERVKER